jgi:hypothetical protein
MHAPQTRRGVLATSFGGIEVAGEALMPRLIVSIVATAALKAMLLLPRVAVAATIGPGSLSSTRSA